MKPFDYYLLLSLFYYRLHRFIVLLTVLARSVSQIRSVVEKKMLTTPAGPAQWRSLRGERGRFPGTANFKGQQTLILENAVVENILRRYALCTNLTFHCSFCKAFCTSVL